MSGEQEQSVGSKLTDEQRQIVAEQVGQLKGLDAGDLAEDSVRIELLWSAYLLEIQAEVAQIAINASPSQTKKAKKKSTASGRRKTINLLRDHYQRPPRVEDLISLFPALKADESLVQLFREDIANASRRSRSNPKLTGLQARVDKMIEEIENPPFLQEIDRNVDRLLGLAGKKRR